MAGVFQIAICKLSYQTTKLMVEIDELNCLQIAILVQVAMFVLDQEILKFAIFFLFLNFRKYVNNTLVCFKRIVCSFNRE